MPDWTLFRQIFVAGLPGSDMLRAVHAIETCLALPQDQALEAMKKETTAASEPQVRLFYQAFGLVQMKLRYDAVGLPGPDAQRQLQDFFLIEQGRGSESDVALCSRMVVASQLSNTLQETYPWLNQPVSPAEENRTRLRESLTLVFNRLAPAAQNCALGRVTAESIHELEQVLEAYQSLIAQTEPDNPALVEAFYAMGHAAFLLAKSNIIFGRNQEGSEAFVMAAQYFEKGADPAQSAECRKRALELAQSLAADRDRAAEPHLQSLIESRSQVPSLERAQALLSLSELAGHAGDILEATQNAEAASHELQDLGFKDPLEHGLDDAIDSWSAVASESLSGNAFLQRITEVGTWYASIFKARIALALKKDPQQVEKAESLLSGIINILTEMQHQAAAASTQLNQELAGYLPALGPPLQTTSSETPAEETGTGQDRDYSALLQRMRDIDGKLLKLRERCNEWVAEQPKEDLLAAAEQLQRDAASLNAPVYDAKTRLERAYILLSLGRAQEVLPLVQEARTMLLAGRPASLGSFSHTFERAYYLESLSRQAMAQIILGDFPGVWQTCEETIRDFEIERYRVNSPYRQSTILGSVAEFYKLGAFAAYKLQDWDNMIEAIELIKARSAIRGRLIPDPPEFSESELAREFDITSATLQSKRAEAGNDLAELSDRRRRLWDMLAMARALNGATRELPRLRLASLQSALADDEALVGYFWLNQGTLLVMCVDRDRFLADRVNLTPSQRKLFDDFIAFVQVFKVAQRSMGTTVAKLGAILLPQFCREFVARKKRLILSPHQSLHLFPFHAGRWENEYVGTRFAVQYVPNFSSLLLPWEGHSENRVLAIAIKDFADPAVPQLANVEQDALAIQQQYAAQGVPVELIMGKAATRERLEQLRAHGRLSHFRCVHLGTHGLSVYETPDQPMESSLLLQNASLDGMDIARLRFQAELAVLCACHSGQRAIAGRELGELPGDDIFGLQSALFQSGVRSVLGALWHVETESSSALVRAFHRHYSQGNAAEVALQLAIKEYLQDPPRQQREIYYWAPYFISSLGRSQAAGQE